jgi:hypothetical protein
MGTLAPVAFGSHSAPPSPASGLKQTVPCPSDRSAQKHEPPLQLVGSTFTKSQYVVPGGQVQPNPVHSSLWQVPSWQVVSSALHFEYRFEQLQTF